MHINIPETWTCRCEKEQRGTETGKRDSRRVNESVLPLQWRSEIKFGYGFLSNSGKICGMYQKTVDIFIKTDSLLKVQTKRPVELVCQIKRDSEKDETTGITLMPDIMLPRHRYTLHKKPCHDFKRTI